MSQTKAPLKVIAFDLDDTLLDTSKHLIPQAQSNAFKAMLDAGLPSSIEQIQDLKRKYLNQRKSHKNVFHFICDELHIPPPQQAPILLAAEDQFYKREIPKDLEPFAGTVDLLQGLGHKYSLYVVTAGDPVTQMKKIASLGFDSYFKAHYCVDSLLGERKLAAFEKIIEREQIDPSQLLSVGNRLDSEIEDAKSLGCQTCWVKHGEYSHLSPTNPQQKPDYEIVKIIDLINACHL